MVGRRRFFVAAACLLATWLPAIAAATPAKAATQPSYIFVLRDAVDVDGKVNLLERLHGFLASFRYRSALRGFAAEMTPLQAAVAADQPASPGRASWRSSLRFANDWIGRVELITEPVDEVGIHMTGRVIDDVAADVEAEDRPSLVRFNDEMLNGGYGHVMLVDGNDERGIDVGLLTTEEIDIASLTSHVDVPDPKRPGKPLFSRTARSTA